MKFKVLKKLLGIVFLLVFINFVNAIGVGCLYSSDSSLEMYPGEEKIVMLNLQNADMEEVVLRGELLEGSEIASLDEGPYTVPQGEKVFVDMHVRLPKDAMIGDKYLIRYSFVQENIGEGGMVSLGTKITRNFNVIVVEKELLEEKPEKIGIVWIVLAGVVVVALIAIIYIIYKFRKTPEEAVENVAEE